MSKCPFCQESHKIGELYCSRNSTDMTHLKSGVFFIRKSNMDGCEPHKTRLSLNFILDGSQMYSVEGKEVALEPFHYLLINEGKSFQTRWQGDSNTVMITVAFQVGLAEKLYSIITRSNEALLEYPILDDNFKLDFIERNMVLKPDWRARVLQCIRQPELGTEEFYDGLLYDLIADQFDLYGEINALRFAKSSTRKEIYRRLSWAREHMHSNFGEDLSIDTLSDVACLSPHHFKRLFKEVFQISPHQYLISIRMEKAKSFLMNTEHRVADVCKMVGFTNTSSFIRLFKKINHTTPDLYRKSA